jgi:Fe-S-cluster containining protein
MRHTDLPHTCDDEDLDGDCVPCEAAVGEVTSDCRCGECCRHLILEALVEDAVIEPKVAEKGSPIYLPAELTGTGTRELIGYLLNATENGGACAFLDRASNLCGIYQTRPLMCRQYDCSKRDELIELGVLPRRG